jgi:tRNA(Ile)-lysidine synthase TilS/MesJ
MKCRRCGEVAQVALPSHHTGFCPSCFLDFFRGQVERAIRRHRMFGKDERVLVAVSGGKDSLALFHVLAELGYDVEGVHIDLGIAGSSEPVRHWVEEFCRERGYVLHVVETAKDGLAIPDVKRAVRRPICSVCGKIKRHWFNRFAYEHGYSALATGHNLDDEAARLFANTLRWDTAYLGDQGPALPAEGKFVRKVKPLCRLTEFETAAYCFFQDIRHWHEPCPYSGGASFTGHKRLLGIWRTQVPGPGWPFTSFSCATPSRSSKRRRRPGRKS